MFNSYNVKAGGVTTNTNINAVSGTLVKNHPNSFFKRFQLGSPYGKNVLSEEPHIFEMGKYREEEKINVVVLQVMLAGGDDEIIAEIVRKKDYYLYSEELEK